MMSTGLANTLLDHVFISAASPFAGSQFQVSMHTAVSSRPEDEVSAPSYRRALYGHGGDYWALGQRTVQNRTVVEWPVVPSGEKWGPVMAIALWTMVNGDLVWLVPLDSGGKMLSAGSRPIYAPGGLVLGFT